MPTEIAKRFAENLAHYRDQAGLSQEALASRAEIHRTQVSELLRGRQLPRLDTLIKLAGALEVDPCQLIEGLGFQPAERRGEFTVQAAKKQKR